jgi:hypothetical protein
MLQFEGQGNVNLIKLVLESDLQNGRSSVAQVRLLLMCERLAKINVDSC